MYRNSPHFLVRLKVPKGDKAFTLVISIYDDTGVLPFTLSSYSAEPAALYAALDCPAVEAKGGHFEKTFRYAWNAQTAGGSMNEATFDRNPMFRLESSCAQRLYVKVRTAEAAAVKSDAKAPHVGVHLFQSGARVRRRDAQEVTKVAEISQKSQ